MRREQGGGLLESTLAHLVLLAAVAFALYPILWVVSQAFSGVATPEARIVPVPDEPSLKQMSELVLLSLIHI